MKCGLKKMDIIGGHDVNEISQVQKGKGHISSHMRKTDPKDKHIH
jgi:hypothetical protein